MIPFQNTYTDLPEILYQKTKPTPSPDPTIIRINTPLAQQLNIPTDYTETPEFQNTLTGNHTPKNTTPIAQAYAGHQFGNWNPQLGDGRALLLGEIIDQSNNRQDIQLKGSGRTEFSRGGDGKSAIGPVIREYILSEAMHALGVPTTRALAAAATGETVHRQEGPLPGGILTRVASSHIRVGTFQYLYANNAIDELKALADYTINRHYPAALQTENPYTALLENVITAHAKLVAHWLSIGFIHGVMNTDNTTISGQTIDYGPAAFLDEFHPQKKFSYIDQQGRYAYGNQPNIALWNLSRFAETLIPLIDTDSEKALQKVEPIIATFPQQFSDQYKTRFQAKFGLTETAPAEIIKTALAILTEQQIDFTQFFTHLTKTANDQDPKSLTTLFPDPTPIENWLKTWTKHTTPQAIQKMPTTNPTIIPRNHQIEATIQAAQKSNYQPFNELTQALQTPFNPNSPKQYQLPPTKEQKVTQTFCGT